MEPFAFLSGNLRGWSSPAQDGERAWVYRAPRYAALLRERAPHLIGFQEFHPTNADDLAPALPFHSFELGCECDTEQYTPIAWDTRRFDLIRSDSCWLNRWRTLKAADWDANHERAVTWVELRDRRADRTVLVVNTHLDHVSEPARVRGAQVILEVLEGWPPQTPIIILGDFNASPYRPTPHTSYTPRTFGAFAEAGFMDAYRSATGIWPPPATFHNYEGERYVPDRHGTWYIDWPLTRNLRVLTAEIVRHRSGDMPVSDHYPVEAVVTYTDAS